MDGKAKEVAVEGEIVKEASGWISGCIGMGLCWGRGVVHSNVSCGGVVDNEVGWGVVDSNVGWGWGVVDSDVVGAGVWL